MMKKEDILVIINGYAYKEDTETPKIIEERDFENIAEEIVKLFAIPVVSNNEVAVCVNCDQEKETHSICSDCLTKIINENK